MSCALPERCPAICSSLGAVLPVAASLDGGQDLLGGQLRVQRRNCVTNQVAHGVHLVGDEAIVPGERLKERRFADGDGVSAFVRVPKSPLARGRASARDGG